MKAIFLTKDGLRAEEEVFLPRKNGEEPKPPPYIERPTSNIDFTLGLLFWFRVYFLKSKSPVTYVEL